MGGATKVQQQTIMADIKVADVKVSVFVTISNIEAVEALAECYETLKEEAADMSWNPNLQYAFEQLGIAVEGLKIDPLGGQRNS